MKKYKVDIELYINDKLYKTVSEDNWNDEADELARLLREKGYREQYTDPPGFEYPTQYVHIWINWSKKKILILSHKARTQFKDKNGYILYEDDFVEYETLDLKSSFNAKPFNEGYYVRKEIYHPGGNSWIDTEIDETNICNIVKTRDVLNFPKRYWNHPQKFNINTI